METLKLSDLDNASVRIEEIGGLLSSVDEEFEEFLDMAKKSCDKDLADKDKEFNQSALLFTLTNGRGKRVTQFLNLSISLINSQTKLLHSYVEQQYQKSSEND